VNLTLLAPWVTPKLEPVTVTAVPAAPEPGAKPVMTGGGKTENSNPLLATPDTDTTTLPLVAPARTIAEMLVALQLATAAGVPLKVTLLVPSVAPKLVPVIVTVAPMGPDKGEMLVMVGPVATVKKTPLLATPATVTITLPLAEPPGTAVVMLVALQLLTVEATPLNLTVLVPCAPPKPLPVMITGVPAWPELGESPVTLGAWVTVNGTPLLATPTVTTTFPLDAPAGTVTEMLVALQLVTVADTPLKVTVLEPCAAPKFVPEMTTAAPTGPALGVTLVMPGAEFTAKKTPLLATPPTVAITLPLVAPAGTVAVILVEPQLLTELTVPLNFTVLVPWLDQKFAPEIMIEAPTGPDVAERLEITGAVVTLKGTALLVKPPTDTITLPLVAPAGTLVETLVALQFVAVAATPLNVIAPVAPKLEPLIVTAAPTGPADGESPVIVGADVTVNGHPLLDTPPAVTITLPLVAPGGTSAVMLFVVQLEVDAATPLNVTVPFVEKLAQLIVTGVPAARQRSTAAIVGVRASHLRPRANLLQLSLDHTDRTRSSSYSSRPRMLTECD